MNTPSRVLVRRGAAALLVGLLGWVTAPRAAGQATPPAPPSDAARTKVECGRNALYMHLRLTGRQPDYDAVTRATPIGPQGTSLLELRDAARRLGVDAAAVTMTREQLIAAPKPVVVYFQQSPFTTQDELPTGHYVVVVGTTDTQVQSLDGSTGRLRTNTWHRFETRWNGYVLTENSGGGFSKRLPWVGSAVMAAVGLTLVVRSGSSRRRNPCGTSTGGH